MPNERLRNTMAKVGLTVEAVADAVQVDPKTVERWISTGRVPHRSHRWKTAGLLRSDEAYLWPAVLSDHQVVAASQAELVTLYPYRGAVPTDLWNSVLTEARNKLDILVYAGLFLVDGSADLPRKIALCAQRGVRVRILLGDPDCEAVARRGVEEDIGDQMAARIRLSLGYFQPTFRVDGIEVRLHAAQLYNSIYQSDDTMLVNIQACGLGARETPVMHLQRVPGGRMFDTYARSFSHVWEHAIPITETKYGAEAA